VAHRVKRRGRGRQKSVTKFRGRPTGFFFFFWEAKQVMREKQKNGVEKKGKARRNCPARNRKEGPPAGKRGGKKYSLGGKQVFEK